jgi:RNA polymerase sigma-70 factor (ECF subfamily)
MEKEYEALTDKELVAVVLSNKNAFSAVIFRYQEPLLRYIRRLGVLEKRDAEDILQNSFVKVYRYLRSFDSSYAFSSWIYRIVHNETYDFFRSKKRRPEITLEEQEESLFFNIPSDLESNEELFDKKLENAKLKQAIKNLDKKYRDVIILRFVEEKDYTEISDILQIPEGTVATLIHRAKKELKKLIDKK